MPDTKPESKVSPEVEKATMMIEPGAKHIQKILAKRFSGLINKRQDGELEKFIREVSEDSMAAIAAGKPELAAKVANQIRVRAEGYRLSAATATWRSVQDIVTDLITFGIQIILK